MGIEDGLDMTSITIKIDRSDITPAYRQIYQQISRQIREGELQAGSYLPKIRNLAQELGVARNTIEAAYKQLALEGYATGHRGIGYEIESLDHSLLSSSRTGATSFAGNAPFPTSPGRNPLGDPLSCKYDFSYGNRGSRDFPMNLWKQHANNVMSSEYGSIASSYMDPFGLPALRREIARYLGKTRNVVCDPRQVMLLPGTQTAVQRICMLFNDEERVIGMEDPGYNAAANVFRGFGWTLKPIPTHKSERTFVSALNNSGTHLLFCTPSNQFPLGYTLPISARLELIDWAKRTDSFIIEDDYCCEYRYDGSSPIPSLQSLAPDRVIYMGTLSKILSPAIRICYVVLPSSLLAKWNQRLGNYFCPIDWLTQAALHSFMTSSDWDKYVHVTVNHYHHKHEALMKAIDKELGDRVHLIGESAGLHILVGDSWRRGQLKLIELAKENDVRVYETHPYWMDDQHPMENYVLLGFSSIDEEDIAPGIKALAEAWYGKQE